jgi:hypothetical protein
MSQDDKEQESPREEGGQLPIQNSSFSTEVTKECVEITECFCAGTITKVSVILHLQNTLPQDDKATYHKALGAYMRVLNNFERIGERIIPRKNRDNRSGEPGPEDGGDENGPENSIAGPNKQLRAQSVGSDDGSAKRKVNVNAFAWVIQDGINPPFLSPSLIQTQTILKNFSQDPKLVKTSLLNST